MIRATLYEELMKLLSDFETLSFRKEKQGREINIQLVRGVGAASARSSRYVSMRELRSARDPEGLACFVIQQLRDDLNYLRPPAPVPAPEGKGSTMWEDGAGEGQ